MTQAFSEHSREKAAKVGKIIVEGAEEHPRREVREKWSDVVDRKESLKQDEAFSDDTDLYTTLQADMITQALEPELFALDAINTLQFELGNGVDSIQIPAGQQLEAVELNADGTLSEDTTDYTSTQVDIKWVGVRTTFSGQLVDKAKVDLLAHRMQQAGRAIARKVDSDIITEMDKASTKGDADYGDNSNYNYLGTGTVAGYDDVVDAMAGARDNDADPDLLLTNNSSWANLMKDADMKNALGFGTTPEGDIPMVQRFGSLMVRATSQVPADSLYLIDTERTGMFVDASSVQTFDGRVNEAYQFEILAVKAYGVSIVQPQTVYQIIENTAEP